VATELRKGGNNRKRKSRCIHGHLPSTWNQEGLCQRQPRGGNSEEVLGGEDIHREHNNNWEGIRGGKGFHNSEGTMLGGGIDPHLQSTFHSAKQCFII